MSGTCVSPISGDTHVTKYCKRQKIRGTRHHKKSDVYNFGANGPVLPLNSGGFVGSIIDVYARSKKRYQWHLLLGFFLHSISNSQVLWKIDISERINRKSPSISQHAAQNAVPTFDTNSISNPVVDILSEFWSPQINHVIHKNFSEHLLLLQGCAIWLITFSQLFLNIWSIFLSSHQISHLEYHRQ